MASGNALVRNQVAIGVPSLAGGQIHQQHNNNNSLLRGFYHQISPLTASATPSPFGDGGGAVALAPFQTSAAADGSSRWSLDATAHTLNCFLRALTFLFSFALSLSLSAPPVSLLRYKEFRYCMSAAIISSVYSAPQLLKAICDISFPGAFISESTSDYISFIFDQFMAYLLMSSSSVCILATTSGHITLANSLHVAAIVATTFSFAACLGFVASALISGYRLCKRIIW